MVSTQFHARVRVFRTDNGGEYQNGVSERKKCQLLEVARSLMLDMSIPYNLWGHAVSSAAYLINRTLSQVLDFKAPRDVFGDHVSPVSVSKLPHKKGYKCYHPHTQKVHVTLNVTFHEEVPYYISPSSPIQEDMGSELESLGLENDVFEDTALGKETTYRTEASDRSPISEDETCGPYEEMTYRPLELNQSPISGDQAGVLGIETTGHIEASDY
ncbi:unnamed protein product [Prunus armeniaca]